MGRKRKIQNTNLPDNVYLRVRKRKSGKIVRYYHYRTADKEILLSVDDYNIALQKAAKMNLEQGQISNVVLFVEVANRYENEIIPQKKINTQKTNTNCLRKLLSVFADAPLDEITPKHIRDYLAWRGNNGAKLAANNEVTLFGHIWRYAREWEYTDKPSPTLDVRKYKINKRSSYISDELFTFVYEKADPMLKDLLGVAYLTGQRPVDVVNLTKANVNNGFLFLTQEKTQAKVKIALMGQLKEIIDRLMEKPSHYFFPKQQRARLTAKALNSRFMTLRKKLIAQYPEKTEELWNFQFRDLRAKCATDRAMTDGIAAAQKQLWHTTSKMTETYIRQALPSTPLMNLPTKE